MRIVTEEPVYLGPGLREAMADPAHFRMTEAACIDYGPQYDEVPRSAPQPRRRWWSRLIPRKDT